MKLSECNFDVDAVVMSRLVRSEPEQGWVDDRNSGVIPEHLYRFYGMADCFSFEDVPKFLSDNDHILYSYLGNLVGGVRGALRDAHWLASDVQRFDSRAYTPYKNAADDDVDLDGARRAKSAYKHFVIEVTAALDLFAEVTVLLLGDSISGLRLGRASFTGVRKFLESEHVETAPIVSLRSHFAEELHVALRPLVVRDGPSKEWHELLQLHRNKLAHLGGFTFPCICLATEENVVGTFLPRTWPWIPDQHIKPTSAGVKLDLPRTRELLERVLVHIDMVELSEQLLSHTRRVLDVGFEVLWKAYDALRDVEYNPADLERLLLQTESRAFLRFDGGAVIGGSGQSPN